MFDEQKSLFDTGDPIAPLLVHQHEVSPCACCSPVFAELAQTMNVSDEEPADPVFWRKSRGNKVGSRRATAKYQQRT